jgi:hypothetical protein
MLGVLDLDPAAYDPSLCPVRRGSADRPSNTP